MKILETFSGYGTASFALKRLNIPHEIVGYSDIDKYANQCFWNNHWKLIKPLRITNNPPRELGDVRKIDPNTLPDFDLLTGGFPCQAFSVAGKQMGELDPRGTLFYEIIRIAEVKKPRFMLLENVKGLTSKKFKDTFDKILSELRRIGYKVNFRVLNSKDYGIPQSRARVWFVCFRDQADADNFVWPEPVELKIFIKDILEPSVDAKYYLSEKLQERFRKYLEDKNSKIMEEQVVAISNCSARECGFKENISPTICARDYKDPKIVNFGQLRRLTPKECFRLMGFLNDEINLDGLSDTQRYKLAGNGQDVNMVTKIFEQMFKRI